MAQHQQRQNQSEQIAQLTFEVEVLRLQVERSEIDALQLRLQQSEYRRIQKQVSAYQLLQNVAWLEARSEVVELKAKLKKKPCTCSSRQ